MQEPPVPTVMVKLGQVDVFCSASGSGDFSEDAVMSIDEQIELAKRGYQANANATDI